MKVKSTPRQLESLDLAALRLVVCLGPGGVGKTTISAAFAGDAPAPSNAARDAILENRIYRNLSDALAGVADYMAMEKLLDLVSNPATDMVVLDTPPARDALVFLDARPRLLE